VGRIVGIAAVLAVLAAVAPGRFGHAATTHEDGPLRWQAPARTQPVAGTATDHLLFGRVVNHGTKQIRLRAADVHLLGRNGHRLPTRAAFADGFVPGVMLSGYGAEMYGADSGVQVGREVVLKTGQAAPLAASFTAAAGERAVAIQYSGGTLRLK
jgi:hypothetical protein